MKKIWGWIVGVALVVALVFYIIWSGSHAAPANTNTNSDDGASTGASGVSDTGLESATGSVAGMNMSSTASGTATSTGMPGMDMAMYKDGTYTGSVADAVYGQLQVSVTISGGMITDVSFPVFPNTPGHTSQVSASALPALKQ